MSEYILKDGSEAEEVWEGGPLLDRLEEFDDASLDYPITSAIPNYAVKPPRSYTWACGTWLDQGEEGRCFPAGTQVRLTDGSHIPIEQVRLRDEVVTAEGGRGSVRALGVRHADVLVSVRLDGHPALRATPEHPFLTRRGYVPASEVQIGDLVAVTRWAADSDEPIVTAKHVDLSEFRGVLDGTVNTGGVMTRVSPLPTLLGRTAALGRLLGLYAAEGNTTPNKVVWSFGVHERDTLVAETVDLIKSAFDAEARIQVRPNNCTQVVLYGKAWRRLFEALVPGTSKHGDKHLSGAVTSGPPDYRRALLDGWLAGDGHARNTEISGATVSKCLALDMHCLAGGLGLRPALRIDPPSVNRHAKKRQMRYTVSIPLGGGSPRQAQQDEVAQWRRVRSVTEEVFQGDVYNLSVEGDESYVADGIGVHNCVEFAICHELLARPVAVALSKITDILDTKGIYWPAQRTDQWEGGSYPGANPFYVGTSVLAGMKVAQDLGFFSEYRWAFGVEELVMALGYKGPAVLGVAWYQGMFDAEPSTGWIRVTGHVRGGHAILAQGVKILWKTPDAPRDWSNVDLHSSYVTLHNSWGNGWGVNGRARISLSDLNFLLKQRGECCIPVRRWGGA